MSTLEKIDTKKLTNQDLLITLLNLPSELVNRILHRFETIQSLRSATMEELMAIEGMDEKRAVQMLTVVELSRRLMAKEMKKRTIIRTPQDAVKYSLSEKGTVGFNVLFLNSKNQILHETFGLSTTVSTVEIFRLAVKYSAKSILCIHRYPGASSGVSLDELELLKRVEQAADLLDIRLVDYLIIGEDSWLSMKEKGYL